MAPSHPESIMNQTAFPTENDTMDHANDVAQITHEKLLFYQRRFEEG